MDTKRTGRALSRMALVAAAAIALAACFPNTPGGAIDIDGTWSGVVTWTLLSDTQPDSIELSISGDDVVMTGGSAVGTSFPVDLAGTLTDQGGGRFTVAFANDGVQQGVFLFDAAGEYAAFIVDESSAPSDGYVSILQKADLQTVSHTEADLIGEWQGIAVRVDSEYGVTESSESSASISDPNPQAAGLSMSGSDGDGTFVAEGYPPEIDGIRLYDEIGFYETGLSEDSVDWSDGSSYSAIYALSYDSDVLAVAFLDHFYGESRPMQNLPNQKFALWFRQP